MLTKMTRKALVAAAAAAVTLSMPAVADDYPSAVGAKLGRGLANLSLGWVEIAKNSYDEPVQHGPLYAPVGLAKGLYHTVGRTLSGIADTATFMIPTKPFTYPLYIWDNFGSETNYGDDYGR